MCVARRFLFLPPLDTKTPVTGGGQKGLKSPYSAWIEGMDEKRFEMEDLLCNRLKAAQVAFDAAAGRQEQASAARALKLAIDELLDYVMRDILPPDLQN